MADRRILAATVSIGLLNVVALGGPGLLQSYDAQTHIFFADHYQHAWFDAWEPKWFDGMWMLSYPPLVHQLIALLGSIVDLEVGYRIVQGLTLVLFPVAIRQLAVETVGPRYASWAALLSIAVPAVYVELYTWGQLPSFVGMVLAIGAAATFSRYLRTGRSVALLACAALTGAAATAHHHAVIFIMPLLLGAMVARWWMRGNRSLKVALLRPIAACALSATVAALALVPFVWWLATHYLPQAELPHPTRDGIFRTAIDSELFFWGLYGAFLILAPAGLVLLSVRRRRSWLPLGIAIVLMAILGLGSMTPLPQVLFGYRDLWRWLVYERFAVWAAVLSVLPASVFVERIARSRVRWPLGSIVAVVLVLGIVRESTFGLAQPLIPRPLQAWEEAEVLKFLADANHRDWNYMTLGLGEAEMARISRLSGARTMDGLYYTAREHPELRASGIGSIDSAYWWRTGLEILPEVMQHADRWNLKWAVVAIPQLQEQLRAAGWRELYTLGSSTTQASVPSMFFQQSTETQAAFRAIYGDAAALAWAAEHGGPAATSLVSIWEAPPTLDIPVLGPPVAPEYPSLLRVWWGTVPLLLLVTGVILTVLQEWRPAVRWPRPAPRAPRRVGKRARALPPFVGALLPWHRP